MITVKFTFNGTDTVSLIPEDQKDKMLLQLCFGEHKSVRVVPSPSNSVESVVLEVTKQPKEKSSADSRRDRGVAPTEDLINSR